jgi:Lysine methyltransferase
MPKNAEIDAPQTLTGLFPPDSDDELDENNEVDTTETLCCYEIQSVTLAGEILQVRQYDYHSHNANRVWPGTFNLADYLLSPQVEEGNTGNLTNTRCYKYQWGNILELGTATGLLAIRLCSVSRIHNNFDSVTTIDSVDPTSSTNEYCCDQIVTSDVQDELDDVKINLQYNYELNNVRNPPLHVPHTWGTGWKSSVDTATTSISTSAISNSDMNGEISSIICQIPTRFNTIIASDILLYVSAYGALVETLQELFVLNPKTKFVMSWNRRMKESSEFFDRMTEAGFDWKHEGKCIFTFVLKE